MLIHHRTTQSLDVDWNIPDYQKYLDMLNKIKQWKFALKYLLFSFLNLYFNIKCSYPWLFCFLRITQGSDLLVKFGKFYSEFSVDVWPKYWNKANSLYSHIIYRIKQLLSCGVITQIGYLHREIWWFVQAIQLV